MPVWSAAVSGQRSSKHPDLAAIKIHYRESFVGVFLLNDAGLPVR